MAAGDVIVVNENSHGMKANAYDGTDDYMLVDAHAVERVAAGDTVGTYTAWIYKDKIANTTAILSTGDNDAATEYMWFFVDASGKLSVLLKHGAATQFDIRETVASIPARTWTHVAVVQNGTQPALYVNGKNVAVTNDTAIDLTFWYDELTGCDKFAIGVLESNNAHTADYAGAIGQVKYFALDLTAEEILVEFQNGVHSDPSNLARVTDIATALTLNITMEDDGITDSGSGADNGTLTGHAYYGGLVSDHSRALERNVTGHAAEKINSILDGNVLRTTIVRGD